ncbi:response regulator [Silvimonas amylolytica]|uniref:response regulator n=1 Tax=Silvimonas amylolytica TaxID=449663 RepID=UPI001664854C|nr:response regulator transcription factor [Silvimonas amylolytica]
MVNSTNKRRILLVDDHGIVRSGMRSLIELEDDLEVTAEASSGMEALQLIRKQDFDIVLLDISMPDKNGVDTLRDMQRIKPELAVLILSGYAEELYALNLIRSGCRGYLSKDADPSEIIKAIRTICNGRRYVSAELADLLANELIKPSDKRMHEMLSEREFQVFYKLASGKSPTDIANELFLSVKTVSTYRARVLEKMNLKTNADLTYYAIKNELIN